MVNKRKAFIYVCLVIFVFVGLGCSCFHPIFGLIGGSYNGGTMHLTGYCPDSKAPGDEINLMDVTLEIGTKTGEQWEAHLWANVDMDNDGVSDMPVVLTGIAEKAKNNVSIQLTSQAKSTSTTVTLDLVQNSETLMTGSIDYQTGSGAYEGDASFSYYPNQ